MRIQSVEAIPLDIGFARTFSFGNTDRNRSQNVIVKVTSDDGIVGYGEACPVAAFTRESQQTIVEKIEVDVREALIGQDPLSRAPLLHGLSQRLSGYPFTMCAVDIALWDLAGKALGQPVWALLGGRYRSRLAVHGSVGMAPAEAMAANALEQVGQGYTTLKLYAGRGELAEDLARLQAVRDAVGPGVDFLLDVNGLWDSNTCLEALPRLKDLNVVLLEQPLPPDDERGLAAVREVDIIPIAADESVYTSGDVAELARARTAHVINLGLSKLGGLRSASECATVAGASGLGVMVGSVLELNIATAAGIHLAAALPELPFPSYLLGPLKYERQITRQPLLVQDGETAVPDGPGLGIEIDDDVLRELDLRRQGKGRA